MPEIVIVSGVGSVTKHGPLTVFAVGEYAAGAPARVFTSAATGVKQVEPPGMLFATVLSIVAMPGAHDEVAEVVQSASK